MTQQVFPPLFDLAFLEERPQQVWDELSGTLFPWDIDFNVEFDLGVDPDFPGVDLGFLDE